MAKVVKKVVIITIFAHVVSLLCAQHNNFTLLLAVERGSGKR